VLRAEAGLPIDDIVDRAVDSAVSEEVHYPV